MSLRFRAKTVHGWTVDAPFKPVVFPDGAVHIQETEAPRGIFSRQIAIVTGMSHDDLFTLAMWAQACAARGESTVLILPYLPGARMDRGDVIGAQIYAEYLGHLVNPDLTIVIDPHSEAALEFYKSALRNVVVFPVERIIRREVQDATTDSKPNRNYVGVIAPDKGAHDRAAAAARVMGVPVYQAEKTRDFNTGKLSGFRMVDELPTEGKLLIVDDICDGGGTFLGLAEATGLPKERLDLWVTHGIFSKGFSELRKHFGVIHTTDSYMSDSYTYFPSGVPGTYVVDPDFVKIHKLMPYFESEIV